MDSRVIVADDTIEVVVDDAVVDESVFHDNCAIM